jgi:hypothetical protein
VSATGYLAACGIYRDEAPYLREWVEFHLLVGVEHLFLYNNGSVDEHLEALAPYLEAGVVTLRDWPLAPGQLEAYAHCLESHGGDWRWMAFLDLDEFLFSPTGRPVPALLADYERWPGVGVNWAVYGNSGHRTMPEGLVTESYLWRAEDAFERHRMIKSIVDPGKVSRPGDPHWFHYKDEARAVDELGRPIRKARTDSVSFARLRVNHYWSKSEEECLRKLQKGKADKREGRSPALRRYREIGAERNQVRDETVLRFVPALRDALSARNAIAA